MSTHNKVSGILTDAEQQKIIKNIDEVALALPFLINLTIENRKKMRKMGAKSIEYVNLNLQGAQNFPKALKVGFDSTEFKNDLNLYNSLVPVAIKLQALLESINDTILAAGSDAMIAADEVYAELKSSAKKDSNVKTLVDQIAKRYSAQAKPRVKAADKKA
jgi:hypothetical protein